VAEQTPICNFGWKAPSFSLPGVDGKTYSLADLRGKNGTLVMFICNHCPYVKAVIDRIVRDANELKAYLVEFSYAGGRMHLKTFKEISNDPQAPAQAAADSGARVN